MHLSTAMGASKSLLVLGCLGLAAASACAADPKQETASGQPVSATACRPTPPDGLGPFYKPDAPLRSSVGTGYVMSGTVRSSGDCSPIPEARIELWLAGPDGKYDDDHRATVISGRLGEYRFESNVPPGYGRRPPHIHVRVTAQGYGTLVTQHYPSAGRQEAAFDLVLVRAP